MLSVSSQTVNFLVVGSLVIRKLHVYFHEKYDLQRRSILKALCLITTALVLMNVRYAYYIQLQSQESIEDVKVIIVMMALCDFIPFLFLIACIHIGVQGEWDCLLSNYLRPSKEKDTTTDAGSHMLSLLKQEIQFDSLMGSTAFPEQYQYCDCTVEIDIKTVTLEVAASKRSRSDVNI